MNDTDPLAAARGVLNALFGAALIVAVVFLVLMVASGPWWGVALFAGVALLIARTLSNINRGADR